MPGRAFVVGELHVEGQFDQVAALIAETELGVGGILGGTPVETSFPVRMEVDYVRVYQG